MTFGQPSTVPVLLSSDPMSEIVCNGCGACCNPVTLPMTQLEAAKNSSISPDEKFWITQILVPITRSDAKERAPHLFSHGKRVVDDKGRPVPIHYYVCGWYDEETKLCTNHEGRPDTCRGYPWYGDAPKSNAALPPTCSFREDIGQPVALIPKP